jgi:regulator of cell morphogenesis and NO signaling
MNNFTTKTIREIAVESPATTRVFEEYKIDFCCGGGRKFDDACRTAGVAPEIVSEKITRILNSQTQNIVSPAQQSVSELIDCILETHHVFTKQELARLPALMEKVCRKHGAQHDELFALQTAFFELRDDLIPHIKKEEVVLFPFIKYLEISAANHISSPRPPFCTVKNPVRVMMTEHDAVGEILRRMREITNNYALPEGACPSYQALYFGLEELEKDLHLHIHLENNILFPRAVELEQKVLYGY